MTTTLLTDTQREVQALAREFAREEIAPHAADWNRRHHVPVDVLLRMGELGLLGILAPEEHEGAGLDYASLCLVVEEIAQADAGTSAAIAVQNGLVASPLLRGGHAGPARALAARRRHRPALRRLRADRAGRRLGHREHPHAGRAGRRRLGRPRRQAVDHQRRLRQPVHRVRPYRRAGGEGRQRVRRRAGARLHGGPRDPEDGTSHLVDRGAVLRRPAPRARPHAGRRERGPQARPGHARRRAHHDRRPGLRHRRRGRRRGGGLRPRAQRLRRPDRPVPGRPVPAGRRGGQARRGAPPDPARRRAARRRPAPLRRRRQGQALRERRRGRGGRRRPSRPSAATATRPSSRPSGSTATPRSPSSTRARARSSGWSSPGTCWATPPAAERAGRPQPRAAGSSSPAERQAWRRRSRGPVARMAPA